MKVIEKVIGLKIVKVTRSVFGEKLFSTFAAELQ